MGRPEPNPMRNDLRLRPVREGDLAIFFEQQRDPMANQMAAFTAKDPANREAFMGHWSRILADAGIRKRSIVFGDQGAGSEGQVVGHVVSFEQGGRREVSYWLGREFWGRGLATRALALFLEEEEGRPLFARAAKDNVASLRVLEKCGFVVVGEDRGFANARGREIEEYVLKLGEVGRARD